MDGASCIPRILITFAARLLGAGCVEPDVALPFTISSSGFTPRARLYWRRILSSFLARISASDVIVRLNWSASFTIVTSLMIRAHCLTRSGQRWYVTVCSVRPIVGMFTLKLTRRVSGSAAGGGRRGPSISITSCQSFCVEPDALSATISACNRVTHSMVAQCTGHR